MFRSKTIFENAVPPSISKLARQTSARNLKTNALGIQKNESNDLLERINYTSAVDIQGYIQNVVSHPSNGVKQTNKTINKVKVRCFIGQDLVEWFLQNTKGIHTRDQALELCKLLYRLHFISVAKSKNEDEFTGDEKLFKFVTYSSHHHIGNMEKQYFISEPRSGDPRLVIFAEFKKEITEFIQTEQQYNTISNCLKQFNHPNIFPNLDVIHSASLQRLIVIKKFVQEGSLRDLIYKAHPLENHMKKYSSKGTALPLKKIRIYGRQILEGLLALQKVNISFPHLSTANILVENDICRITDIESYFLGYKPTYSNYMAPLNKRVSAEVLCFGHVLYEMSTGSEFNSPIIVDDDDLECDSEVKKILKDIFVSEHREPVSVQNLIQDPFFSKDLGCIILPSPPCLTPDTDLRIIIDQLNHFYEYEQESEEVEEENTMFAPIRRVSTFRVNSAPKSRTKTIVKMKVSPLQKQYSEPTFSYRKNIRMDILATPRTYRSTQRPSDPQPTSQRRYPPHLSSPRTYRSRLHTGQTLKSNVKLKAKIHPNSPRLSEKKPSIEAMSDETSIPNSQNEEPKINVHKAERVTKIDVEKKEPKPIGQLSPTKGGFSRSMTVLPTRTTNDLSAMTRRTSVFQKPPPLPTTRAPKIPKKYTERPSIPKIELSNIHITHVTSPDRKSVV